MLPSVLLRGALHCPILLSLALAILIGKQSNGQILRVNKGSATTDTSGFFNGQIGLNIAINNRNSTAKEEILFTQAQLKGDASYTSNKHIYYLIEDARYYQSTGGPLQSTGYGHVRVNLMRRQRLSYELFAQGQYDQGRNLDSRFLFGAGLRFRILNQLSYGIGAIQEHENWEKLTTETKVVKDITKMSSYLTGRIDLSEQASISLTIFYQIGYDLEDEVWRNRVSLDSSLDVFLARKLDLSIGYSLTYEDLPIIAISKSVFAFGTGISYEF